LEGYKTIKELADELEYSKQTIQKIIEGFPDSNKPKKKGNRYVLSTKDQKRIKQILGIDISPTVTNKLNNDSNNTDIGTDNSNKNEYIGYLLSENDLKNRRIETLEKLLDQQQQLTLQSNKQIESLQQQLLLSTQRDGQEEEMTDTKVTPEDQVETLEETVQEKIKSGSKKWWQFWKSKKTDY